PVSFLNGEGGVRLSSFFPALLHGHHLVIEHLLNPTGTFIFYGPLVLPIGNHVPVIAVRLNISTACTRFSAFCFLAPVCRPVFCATYRRGDGDTFLHVAVFQQCVADVNGFPSHRGRQVFH